MNRQRRNMLNIAITELESAQDIISDVCEDESDALGNMPENLESSDKYQKIEECVDCLENAASSISDALDNLREAIS